MNRPKILCKFENEIWATVLRIACGFDASSELDALMKFWKETCSVDSTISDADVVNFFTDAVQGESFIIFPYR